MFDKRDGRLAFRVASRDAEAIAVLARLNGRSTGAELRAALRAHLDTALNATTPGGQAGRVLPPSTVTGAERVPAA